MKKVILFIFLCSSLASFAEEQITTSTDVTSGSAISDSGN